MCPNSTFNAGLLVTLESIPKATYLFIFLSFLSLLLELICSSLSVLLCQISLQSHHYCFLFKRGQLLILTDMFIVIDWSRSPHPIGTTESTGTLSLYFKTLKKLRIFLAGWHSRNESGKVVAIGAPSVSFEYLSKFNLYILKSQ